LLLEELWHLGADDLHNPVQDFKIFGGRDPAHGLPLNYYRILKQLFVG
jgi:hypothetical protein